MEYNNYSYRYGYPFKGYTRDRLVEFLKNMDLTYEEGIEFTVIYYDNNDSIIATGSLEGSILKCIAVSDAYQGEGLTASIVSCLTSEAYNNNNYHLFLFTKPGNINFFNDLGFYKISQTKDTLLMENKKNGIYDYVSSLKNPEFHEDAGAIVVNCNPFTKGHQYLIETAAAQCDLLHLFVLSEDKSAFPLTVRYDLVKKGVEHIKNVVLHKTSDYLISSVTFPSYFIKDKKNASNINSLLDLTIFLEYFAVILNIKKRFVGTEPFCPVTNTYNRQMKDFLTHKGIKVIEIPRYSVNNIEISASRVRKLMIDENYNEIVELVPKSTFDFIISEEGNEIRRKMLENQIENYKL